MLRWLPCLPKIIGAATIAAVLSNLGQLAPALGQETLAGLEDAARRYQQEIRTRLTIDVVEAMRQVPHLTEQKQHGEVVKIFERLAATSNAGYDTWIRLARAWLRSAPQANRAQSAAFVAYQKAQSNEERSEALLVLAGTLKVRMDALLAQREQVGSKIEKLLLHARQSEVPSSPDSVRAINEAQQLLDVLGHRFVETSKLATNVYDEVFKMFERTGDRQRLLAGMLPRKVESFYAADSVRWRADEKGWAACIEFNLPLLTDANIYRTRFVELSEIPPANLELTIERNVLCVRGLVLNKKYTLTLKLGLPSGGPDVLSERKTFELNVPDLPPSIHFRSAAYIVPNTGSRALQVTTINVNTLELDLFRISDRTLYRKVALGEIGKELSDRRLQELKENFAEKIWTGRKQVFASQEDAKARWNRLVTTTLPMSKLLSERRLWMGTVGPKGDGTTTAEWTTAGTAEGEFATGRFFTDDAAYQALGRPSWEPGVYALVAGNDRGRGSDEISWPVQWFVFTDIGLTYYYSDNHLYVIARSLATGDPVQGAQIELVAANNRVLEARSTDERGTVRFDGRLARGDKGNRLIAILAYTKETAGIGRNDFSYVDFRRDAFDLTKHGIAGRAPSGPLDAFVYTDRGVYRPGSDRASVALEPEPFVQATVLLRNHQGAIPDAKEMVPITVELVASNKTMLARSAVFEPATLVKQLGGIGVVLHIPPTAPLGEAQVRVIQGVGGPELGFSTINIQHFKADQARITADTAQWKATLVKDGKLRIEGEIKSEYLYSLKASATGDAPVAGASSEVEVLVEKAASPRICTDEFNFGQAGEQFSPYLVRREIGTTSPDGSLPFDFELLGIPPSSLPLQARVGFNLFEAGGTIASKVVRIPVRREQQLIGIRRKSLSAEGPNKFRATFDAIALTPDLQPAERRVLSYRVLRERPAYVWYESNSEWRYRANVTHALEAQGRVETVTIQTAAHLERCDTANATLPSFSLEVGSYLIEVTDESGAISSLKFEVGTTSNISGQREPQLLTLRSNGHTLIDGLPDFMPGEVVELTIESPAFDGSVLVALVNGDRVETWLDATTERGVARVSFTVPDIWTGQGIYALATVFRRGADGSESLGPHRAIGALHFTVGRRTRTLSVSLEHTPFRITPSANFEPRLFARHFDGKPFNGKAMVAFYAVDEGLVNLTEHPLPEPEKHFFGQRRLRLGILDSYGRLLLTRVTDSRSGGDAQVYVSRLLLNNYLSQKIVAIYQVPREFEFRNGLSDPIFLQSPFTDFAGTVRIAALVWTGDKIGTATKNILVRAGMVSSVGLPRFMAPGDRVRVPLNITNLEALEGPYRVRVDGAGRVTEVLEDAAAVIEGNQVTMSLPSRQRRTLMLDVNESPSEHTDSRRTINVRMVGTTPDNPFNMQWNYTYALRRPIPTDVNVVARFDLGPGQRLALDANLIPSNVRQKYQKHELQVRVSRSSDLLALLPGAGSMVAQPGTLERLIWQGTLHVSEGRATQDLQQIIGAIIALQRADGGFRSHRSTVSAIDTMVENKKTKDSDEGADDVTSNDEDTIWNTALALDFLRLAGRAGLQRPEVVARAADFLKAEIRQNIRRDRPSLDTSEGLDRFKILDRFKKVEGETDPDSQIDQNSQDKCTESLAYATFALTALGMLDVEDYRQVATQCLETSKHTVRVILAAAAREAGKTAEEIRPTLASLTADAVAAEGEAIENKDTVALLLAFLARSGAGEPQLSAIMKRLAAELKTGKPLSLAAQSWLARILFDSPAQGAPLSPLPVVLEAGAGGSTDGLVLSQGRSSLVTQFRYIPGLAGQNASVRNTGTTPLQVSVFVRGFPAVGPTSDAEPAVKRRIFNAAGQELTGAQITVKQHELLVVLLEGRMPRAGNGDDDGRSARDVVVLDLLPAGFEIVNDNVYRRTYASSGLITAAEATIPEPKGQPLLGEARDDMYLGIIRADPKDEDFRIGYTVRASTVGEFTYPPLRVESRQYPDFAEHFSAHTRLRIDPR